uniref:Craniofacial development protein 1 n=1 Tax=Phallusia mammillata TaxID=59560 RepID=A0A6F9D9S3_9ASCI|nr:craniofacial development protein 1-like [Phallusia mammillata]
MSSNEEDYSSADDDDYIPEGDGSEDDGDNVEDCEPEKEHKISDDIDPAKKEKVDQIWENFKSDTSSNSATKETSSDKSSIKKTTNGHTKNTQDSKESLPKTSAVESKKDTVTITKVYDFAGEEVTVTKEVKRESKEAQNHLKQQSTSTKTQSNSMGLLKKRPGGGIGSVLGKLGKKPKLSTLEKSKLDWDCYKTEEGIGDELESYKKGKEGYLEKVQFLERTDMRQFNREREMRLGRTSKR